MNTTNYCVATLPDVEMYGGDTTPWEIAMLHENGTGYTLAEADGYSCVLTVTAFSHAAGLGSGGSSSYALQKAGTIKTLSDGSVGAEITFSSADTKTLAGKFVYQVEFINGEQGKVGQGYLNIRNNINR